MALTFSTGFVNAVAGGIGYYELMNGAIVNVYSGSRPAPSPDQAVSGTLLFTGKPVGTYVAETKAACSLAITGGGGTITSFKIGGVDILGGVSFTVDANTTTAATALAAAINAVYTYPDYYATSSSNTVIIYAPKGSGTFLNGLAINATFATCTLTAGGTSLTSTVDSTGNALFGSGAGGSTAGVASAYGLTFTYPITSGTVSKSGTWQGTAVASGDAGWFRVICGDYRANATDSGAADSGTFARIDGVVGLSGQDMNVASTAVTSGTIQTINTFALTIPTT